MSEPENSLHPFAALTPDLVMDAVESVGYRCDCRTFPLNSYENRVYQVGIEDAEPLIAKFYRPGRWTNEQILEEHLFTQELADHDLPVVAPLALESGETLHAYRGFRFSLSPRRGGRPPEFDNLDHLLIMGRLLGRIHRVGATKPFIHRPTLNVQNFGEKSIALIRERWIPADYATIYRSLTDDLLALLERTFHLPVKNIRTHGDCHAGNLLWREGIPNLVDLDDARMAPAVQDLWMMLSGDATQQRIQLSEILEGYEEFTSFDPRELQLIEGLRTLRILHYTAWLAGRWDDPAFPVSFPWFNTPRYWSEHILTLKEQISALQEPSLLIP